MLLCVALVRIGQQLSKVTVHDNINNRDDWVIFIAILRISPYSNYDPIRSLKIMLKTVGKTIDENVYYFQ